MLEKGNNRAAASKGSVAQSNKIGFMRSCLTPLYVLYDIYLKSNY